MSVIGTLLYRSYNYLLPRVQNTSLDELKFKVESTDSSTHYNSSNKLVNFKDKIGQDFTFFFYE